MKDCEKCKSKLIYIYGKLTCPFCFQLIKTRKTWLINPKTKIKDSKKKYNRNKEKLQLKKEKSNDE
jgi:uncharacterized Zn finger protein (UPF0148 family)